jgi:hypothetical protein
MSTLREQFETWCKTERNHNDLHRTKKYPSVPSSVADEYMNPVVELAWQAFQAGHAASGRDELLEALRQIELAFRDSPAHGALACKMAAIATEAIKKARSE